MITLFDLLKVMSLDCELEIIADESSKMLVRGRRSDIDVPMRLYNVPVVHIVPGIVTMVFIKESKY